MIALLVEHGADIRQRRRDGRTAHTLAELHGNHEIAAWLLAHGAQDELSHFDRFLSACARGDRSRAETMLMSNPGLRGVLCDEHQLMLHLQAERGNARALDAMLACGLDVGAKDRDGATALHHAAMRGHADAVRVLIAHGATVNALDMTFAATPLVWAAQGWGHAPQLREAYIRVAQLLIAAGSSLEWTPPDKAPDPEYTQEQLIELCHAANATVAGHGEG
jgi:ankyrin repeat protein